MIFHVLCRFVCLLELTSSIFQTLRYTLCVSRASWRGTAAAGGAWWLVGAMLLCSIQQQRVPIKIQAPKLVDMSREVEVAAAVGAAIMTSLQLDHKLTG